MPKYKPLDLSFLANRYSPQRDSIANTAQMIMANSRPSDLSPISMKEIADAKEKAQKEFNSAHKQTFLSSLFDLLQTPLYGVANALDESMAGHQSDSDDSFLEDVAKSAGGLVTGSLKGLGAGLRGATGIIDALPGIDINDEWQSDPTDKTHIGDVMIRGMTGMSTADAVKPENLEKVKGILEDFKNKPFYEKNPGQLALEPLLPDVDDPDFQAKFNRRMQLGSLPLDIAIDPLNAVSLPSRIPKATEGIVDGLGEARASKSTSDAVLSGLQSGNKSAFQAKPNSLDMPSPVASIGDPVEPGVQSLISSIASGGNKGNFKDLANLGRREKPVHGELIGGKEQHDLVQQITRLAVTGKKGWAYKASDLLRAHPNVQWTETEKLLQKADEVIKKIGRRGANGLGPALRQRITQDVTRKTGDVERRILNAQGEIKGAGVSGEKIVSEAGGAAPKLKRDEARLANQTIRKFESEILGKKKAPGTGEGLARAIAEGRNVRYSGPQQARMWNHINTLLNKVPPKYRYEKAMRTLRAVENYYITKGVIPHSWAKTSESVPLRLSQVAEAIGPDILAKSEGFITGILRGDPKDLAKLTPEQVDAIKVLRENEALAAAPAVQKGIEVAKTSADQIAKLPMSVGRKADVINSEIKNIKQFTAAQGGGDSGAHVVGQYMGNLLGKSDPVNGAIHTNRLKTEAWLAKGALGNAVANDPEFVRSVSAAIIRASNLPSPAQLSGLVGSAAKVKDWLGARFNAAYGVQDMREIYLIEQASAMSTAARRAKLLNALAKRFPPSDADLWHEAFRTAQQNGIADGRVAELHSEIAKVMENLFGGTGLRSGAIADSTVVGRSRLLVDELNKNLRRFGLAQFEFSAGKKVEDAAGNFHDFSKGMDWMKSWEAWDVKKPYEFLQRIQSAIEHTVREKNMFDEIVSRFASSTKKGGVKYAVDHPRLRGFYFTKEGAEQARVFVKMLDEVSTPNSKAFQHFDHVLSKLKASLTIYIPGHHWTNLIGDTYYNWIAGVNKPVRYEQAMKTMLSQKGRYIDFADFSRLTGPEALQNAIARSVAKPGSDLAMSSAPAGRKVIVTMQNGTKVTADMIYTAAMKQGILPSAKVLEDVTTDVSSLLDKIRPLGGRGQNAVHKVSEIRDHIPRLAQFIDGIAKSKGSFTQAIESSARSVRKWHPDGLDLTKFERNVMKRVFPFYSWTRKAIPLAIESTLFAAPKVMAYPRLMEAIALSNGVDANQGVTDPFPGDQMFPDWMRARGIGPIAGDAGSYTMINPSTPVLDIMSMMGQPGTASIDMLNPLGKVPLEVAQGQTLGRDVPIGNSNAEWLDYFAKQVPVVSQAGRASGQFGVSDSTKAEGFPNYTNILNMLTGLKKVDTGKYQKSAQFDLRDYFKQKAQQQGR